MPCPPLFPGRLKLSVLHALSNPSANPPPEGSPSNRCTCSRESPSFTPSIQPPGTITPGPQSDVKLSTVLLQEISSTVIPDRVRINTPLLLIAYNIFEYRFFITLCFSFVQVLFIRPLFMHSQCLHIKSHQYLTVL